MKIILKIICVLIVGLSFLNIWYANTISPDVWNLNNRNDVWPNVWNLKTWAEKNENSTVWNNTHLENIKNELTDFSVEKWWQEWIRNMIIRIARDLKNLFFLISWIYFLVIVIKLLFSSKTEEEVSNFKKAILWISVWIIIIQIAYSFIMVLFDRDITVELSTNLINIIINPFISLLQSLASFRFVAVAIYAYYRIVTSNGDEEKAKSWKMSIVYAILWFVIVKISNALVTTTYWKTNCSNQYQMNCVNQTDLSWFWAIIVKVINWTNSFVWLIVILLIIYAWFLVLTSSWDEEKLKKAKSIIIYIAIWLFILIASYLILTFFILPETKI